MKSRYSSTSALSSTALVSSQPAARNSCSTAGGGDEAIKKRREDLRGSSRKAGNVTCFDQRHVSPLNWTSLPRFSHDITVVQEGNVGSRGAQPSRTTGGRVGCQVKPAR